MDNKTVTETRIGKTLFIVTAECSPTATETVERIIGIVSIDDNYLHVFVFDKNTKVLYNIIQTFRGLTNHEEFNAETNRIIPL